MDELAGRLESLLTSPWGLLVIFVVCVVDAFFPLVPSETLVISGGVFAASGDLNLAAVIAVGATGAIVGDHVSYGIGRVVGPPAVDRMARRKRLAAVRDNAQRALDRHGGPALIALRFVPAGRSLSTALAGSLQFPVRRFSPYVLAGGILWAVQGALLGYFAGNVIHDNYAIATAAGIVISIALAAGIELARHRFLARRARRRAAAL